MAYTYVMTESLQQAFAAAAQLPQTDQDAFAQWILSELESDAKWTASFGSSQDQLASLATEALEEHARGDTRELNSD
jgi:hypothetical protein